MKNREQFHLSLVIDEINTVLEEVMGYNKGILTRTTKIRSDLQLNSFDIMDLFINLDIRLLADLPDEVAQHLDLSDASLEEVAQAYLNSLQKFRVRPEEWKIKLAKTLRDERATSGEICADIVSIIDGL